ncbi:hypothetical protein BDN70DRAFT_873424 [Pholiota conissans]|uniref:Uncharacterized protein n=1 Tax=Pholiota conissans TaxID=109636 RepID=A0A9P5ZBG1_9AGAR|nr:hypothetical protein BDN70DRAFT_873424 [Pholiota conissans]
MAFLNQTFDDRDSRFVYQGSWSTGVGVWNASSVGLSGTLASTNDVNANVTFTFPVPAIAFYYYGIPRSHGGSYGICVDCDPNNRVFSPVDGFNATDDGKNPPIVLYSQTFSTPAVHEIIIRNQPDPRGTPAGNSQLTLDRVDLEVPNSNAPATVTLSSTPSPTATNSSAGAASSTTHHSSPVGVIVGIVLGVFAFLITLALFVYWLRLRRRNNELKATSLESPPPHNMHQHSPSLSTEQPYTTSINPTTPSTLWGYAGRNKGRPSHQPMMPSVTSVATSSQPPPSVSTSGVSNGSTTAGAATGTPLPPRHRRHEQDAGPVPVEEDEEEEEEEETLPPAYGQVFAVGRRASRRSRRTLPAPPVLPGKAALSPTQERNNDGDGRR